MKLDKCIYLAILTAANLFSITAHADSYFGFSGQHGRPGVPGQSGRSGQSVQYNMASGSYQFYIDGTSGSDAFPGDDGDHASSCYHQMPAENLRGASGGDGGYGGDGGHGGDGGSALVFFTDESQLRGLFISALAGNPGRAAFGGRGGRGCQCNPSSWVKRICRKEMKDGKPIEVCQNQSFFCSPGADGRSAQSGQPGRVGRLGALTLVKGLSQLTPDKRSETLAIPSFDAYRLELAENLWAHRQGANSRIAPGSRISDTYVEFVERKLYPIQLFWKAQRSVQEFANFRTQVRIEQQRPRIAFDAGLFALYEQKMSGQLTEFTVTDAAREEEFQSLRPTVTGNERATVLHLADSSPWPNLMQDEIELVLERRTSVRWDEVYRAKVPPQFVTRSGREILVRIGELPVENPDKTFNSKKKIRAELLIHRRAQQYETDARVPKFEHTLM